MEVFGMAIFRTTVVIFIIVGVQATKTIATSSKDKGSTHQNLTTPTPNHGSTTLPTTVRHNSTTHPPTPGTNSTISPSKPGHSTMPPSKAGNHSTMPPSKPGNHSTIPPPKPGNHSTIPTSKSGNHSEPTTQESHSSETPSPKGHGKGAHGDSRGKWVAAGFAVFFAITTIIMTALYCRQRKIYRELEGDSSLSRLI